MQSTRKSRTYSAPRRESIEDHLTVLAFRAEWLQKWLRITWSPKLATAAWVRSLTTKKKGVIRGPRHEGRKGVGAGVRSRFLPRDYRDLLEIIRLKSLGVKSRNRWILHLWLRGREYPMARVRTALLAEARRRMASVLSELAPTGRFRYDINRRMKRVSRKSREPDYDEFFRLAFALMTRPSELQNVKIDPRRFASMLCEGTQVSIDAALPYVEKLVASIKAGVNPDNEVQSVIGNILEQTPHGQRALAVMRAHPNPEQVAYRMHGVISDDRGRSRLLGALERATDEQLLRARAWRSFFRRVSPSVIRQSLDSVAIADRLMVDSSLEVMEMLRQRMFSHPDMDAYIFMMFVDDEIPAEPPSANQGPVDASAFLQAWRQLEMESKAESL